MEGFEKVQIVLGSLFHHTLRVCLDPLRSCCVYVYVSAFFFFFLTLKRYCSSLLWTVAATFDREQCTCALFMNPQITLFSNFFIKNGSHGTIYTFKNYFATLFFSFQFSAVSKSIGCWNGKTFRDKSPSTQTKSPLILTSFKYSSFRPVWFGR